jgi:hypothetical protein
LVVPQPAMNAHRALRVSNIAVLNEGRFMRRALNFECAHGNSNQRTVAAGTQGAGL